MRGVFTFFFKDSRSQKKHSKYGFLALWKSKSIVFTVLPLVTKATLFAVVFGQRLAKTPWYLRSFQHVAILFF